MAYDFQTMSPSALRAALNGPTGDLFMRRIANGAIDQLEQYQAQDKLLRLEDGNVITFVSCRNPVVTTSRRTEDFGTSVIETITETTATEYRK